MFTYIYRTERNPFKLHVGLSNLLRKRKKSSLVMDHNEKSPSHKSFSSTRNEETQPDDLLEENWFFGNLLDKKTTNTKTMLRSYSDPSPSCMENEKLSQAKRHSLVRAPSLPPSLGREKRGEDRESASGSKGKRKPRMSLNRAPSLPPCIGREEDVESEFSLSRLIRQASLSSSEELPPKHNSKGIKQCSSAPRYRPQAKSLPENNETGAFNEMKTESIKVQSKLRKSLSDVKLQQVEGIKDTCYNFEKKYIDPITIPCLRENPRIGYGQSSSTEDMKAQIKYWARSVAANVR